MPISVFTQPGCAELTLTFVSSKLGGKMDCEGVQSRLRCVVREGFEPIDRRLRVGVQRQRTKNARKVHDAAFRSLLDQWQQYLRQLNGSKEVCVEGLAQKVLARRTCIVRTRQMASLATPALLMRISSLPKFLSKYL